MIFDKKLDWKAHLENRMCKARSAYWQWCRRAVGKTWGLSLKVYLSYVSLLRRNRVELSNAQTRLSHWQRMTCLGITGGMRSTPTYGLEVILMLPPLQLFIKQETDRRLIDC
jgi:hypothetical protein